MAAYLWLYVHVRAVIKALWELNIIVKKVSDFPVPSRSDTN
jgi:hypothetical protein